MKTASSLWLAILPLSFASQSVFSVYDDILAFPQYEIVFSDSYISDTDAESRLAYAASSSSARSKATSLAGQEPGDGAWELSRLRHDDDENGYGKAKGDDDRFDETVENYEPMILNGKRYLCAIPTVETPVKDETSEAAARAEEEKELSRATERGWELLKDMEGHCMYFISGWWSYSFCYNSHVKQFHQLPPGKGAPIYPPNEDPTTPSYVLGRFGTARDELAEPEQTRAGISDGRGGLEVAELQAKGEMRYLVQKLGGGTTCDLTGKERKVEVQFHCHPQSADRIGWIKEVTTCSYLMVIYTPRLCNDIAFLPPRETQAHPIACREVLSASEIPAWETRKISEAERHLLQPGRGPNSNPHPNDHDHPHPAIIVGGIEVGAMQHVGTEGRRIESGQVAGGVLRVDVVARGDAKADGGKVHRLSNEDLRTLNVDPETVDRLREELKIVSGGKAWRLEVVDGPGGVHELRGVVDGDGMGEGGEEEGRRGSDGEGRRGRDGEGPAQGQGEDGAGYEDEGEGSEEEYREDL